MNSLQIGLIAIGAVVVAALFLLHWWQSRRNERKARLPKATHNTQQGAQTTQGKPNLRAGNEATVAPTTRPNADTTAHAEPHHNQPIKPFIDDEPVTETAVRVEPTLGVADDGVWVPSAEWRSPAEASATVPPSAPAVPAPQYVPNNVHAPVASPVTASAPASTTTAARLMSEWPFDERLHAHASLVSLSGSPFDAAPFVSAAGRALAWVRLFRQSPWEAYDPANIGSVQQLALALPLASRAGPIEAHDIDEWRFVLTELANAHGCEAHFHGFRDAPQRATELDSFLAAVDVIPVAYLVKRDGQHWLGTRLRGTLEANGFRLQSDGRFAYHEVESDAVIFHAVDGFERPFTPERLRTENFTALRCTLEPVRLSQPLVRFDMYRQSLRALAKLLDADLKTSEGSALDETEFTAMRDDVKTAMDALANAGIEPGSDTARSLFS